MEMNNQPRPDLSRVQKLLEGSELKVINLGLQIFAETLQQQGVGVIQVDWHPPAGGDDELGDILADLSDLN